MLGFRKNATPLVEEPEGMYEEDDDADLDQLPTPQAPPPSWMDLDVETDLDVLLKECFDDIQHTLTQWAMVTGPRQHPSSSSHGSNSSEEEEKGFQILPLLDSVTKMINSVKNYMHQRHDLSDTAQNKVRHAALDLLNSLRTLETRFRKDEENEHGEYAYHSSEFGMLEQERKAIHAYLATVEKYAFNPPHHIGSPPAVFSPEIRALMLKTAVHHHQEQQENQDSSSSSSSGCVPVWLQRSTFQNDPKGKWNDAIEEEIDTCAKLFIQDRSISCIVTGE